MVQVNGHGGGCCGARHLRGFTDAENRDPNLINVAAGQVPAERMTEVILNGTQVRQYPAVLERLNQLGFVLDGHWINGNHGSHNYRFSRCDNRLPLDLAGWNGMVMSAGLQGRLPGIPGAAAAAGALHAPYIRPLPDWQRTDATTRHRYLGEIHNQRRGVGRNPAGQRYRINSRGSRYNGREFIALGNGNGGWDRNATIAFRDPDTRRRFEISAANCVLVAGAAPAIVPPAGRNMREFRVGDRIQVVNSWGQFQRGLVGTVTRVVNPQNVIIQFDTPNTAEESSATNYITIVDHDMQPDIPRERIQPPRERAAPPAPPAQRHADGDAVPAAPPAPVAPPPATVLFTTFHCVFRDGRRGAGYDSFNEAWEQRGRRTRVDARDIMSNGDTIWRDRVGE